MRTVNNEIERRLAVAIEESTPDVLDAVLQQLGLAAPAGSPDRLEIGKEERLVFTTPQPATRPEPIRFPAERAKSRRRNRALRWIAATAAVLAVGVGVRLVMLGNAVASVIGLDVNPSVELRVNRNDKVLSVNALNADAEAVLADMNLGRVDLDVAINAIVGSMLKNGYLSDADNAVLITVESRDVEQGAKLQERLTEDVSAALDEYEVEAAVFSQVLAEDEKLVTLAEECDISLGKAALVDLVVQEDETLSYEEIAELSISDISLLIAAQENEVEGLYAHNNTGESTKYVGEQAAIDSAVAHAEVESELESADARLRYEDGRMVYRVRLFTPGAEFLYLVDAASGDILELKMVWTLAPAGREEIDPGPPEDPDPIDPADLPEDPDPPDPATEEGPGEPPPELPGEEEVLIGDPEPDPEEGEESESESVDDSPLTPGDITEAQARAIALNHAGETEATVTFLSVIQYSKGELQVYQLVFLSSRMKYVYEINADTGEVITVYSNAIHAESNSSGSYHASQPGGPTWSDGNIEEDWMDWLG